MGLYCRTHLNELQPRLQPLLQNRSQPELQSRSQPDLRIRCRTPWGTLVSHNRVAPVVAIPLTKRGCHFGRNPFYFTMRQCGQFYTPYKRRVPTSFIPCPVLLVSSLRSVSARICCLPITRNSPTTSPTLVRIGRTHVAGATYCRKHDFPQRVERTPRVVRDRYVYGQTSLTF